jgi:hypothetical protein
MSESPPTPQPQVSGDGKFYWDGTHWVPLQNSPATPVTPVTPASNSDWGKVAAVAVVALIVGGIGGYLIGSASHGASPSGAAYVGTSPPASSAAPESPSAAPEAPRTLSAKGSGNTVKFNLAGGDYTVNYNFSGPCFYGAHLQQSPNRGTALASGTGPIKGTNNVYGVAAGSYYIYMISGSAPDCPWTITLVPK